MTQLDETTAVPPAPPDPARRRRPAGIWVVLAIGIVMYLVSTSGFSVQGKLADVQKNDNSSFLPASADSTKVANQTGKFIKVESIPGFVVYQRTSGLTAPDKAKIAKDIVAFRSIKGVDTNQVGGPTPNKSGTAVAVSVPLAAKVDGKSVNGPDLVTAEKAILKQARDGAPAGLAVHSAGAGGLLVGFIDAFNGLDSTLLLAAGAVVVILLLLVYRSPVLWIFPLFSAGLALGAASLVIYWLAKNGTITLNGQSQGILSVLVIGAGTDYALLFISRYREELHTYHSAIDALVAAWKGTVVPIAASAVTVILGLICLTFADLKSTAGLGPVCAIGIACTAAVMLTFLPLFLLLPRIIAWVVPVMWPLLFRGKRWRLLEGRWIFWPRVPAEDHRADVLSGHGVWTRVAQAITRRRRRSWGIAGVVLLALVALLSTLRIDGLPIEKGFTTKPDAVVGQQIYDANFAQGAGAPAQILANATKAADVIAAVKRVPGVVSNQVCIQADFAKVAALAKRGGGVPQSASGCPPAALQVSPVGDKTLINATLTSSYDSQQAYDTVTRIRSTVSRVAGADALVGGQSAVNLDVQDASRHDRNLIIPVVLLVILVVLGVVLRSLLAPIILIATVVLSFTAALGVSAFFFNHVFHFANADPSFPLFAFVFLVALGIDYNIFLMTRVREEALRFGTRPGIVRGLAVTGGVITSAGLVLAATFVVLGVLPIVFLAEIGFTVAFGVLLDTIVVRSILVPALSYDIGKRIWWPSKLAAAGAAD